MNELYSGVLAGTLSTFICNPLDIIRINHQVGNKIGFSGNLTRGLSIALLTIPSFWGIYFPLYSKLREHINKPIAAYLSCSSASIITTPLWVIKQKIQTGVPLNLKTTPLRNYYSGILPTLLINMSFMIQIPLYEYLRDKLTITDTKNIFIITAFSKTISSSVVYPFDTLRCLKRKMQTNTYISIIRCMKPLDFYRGFHIYLLRSIPYHTTIFCTYEFIIKM